MSRVSEDTISKLNAFLESLPEEAKSKCVLCNEALTHLVKLAEVQTGAGTATVTKALSEKINENAKHGDYVSGDQLRGRVQRAEGIICTNHADNSQFRTSFTGDNEWYTPIEYVEAAREVMGSIDLDPATSNFCQIRIKAKEFCTIETNGLNIPWIGNVWLNPPYSQPDISNFIKKLVNEYLNKNVKQAILLTNNFTDTAWFHLAESAASLICFTKGRIKFSGIESSPTQGSAFFYFGKEEEKFKRGFLKYGFIR